MSERLEERLRRAARTYRRLGNHTAEDIFLRAADAICELQAENDRLRGQSERLFDKTLELATENSKMRELCKLCEREAENAKLRELVRDLYEMAYPECPSAFEAAFADRMHELGVDE